VRSSYGIAIVGRPNVGKSRLFNRLARERISVVHDAPGVTRDVIAHEIGENIILMDTGGIGLSGANSIGEIAAAVEEQVALAIGAADLIFFVVDATEGIVPMDYTIADTLRKNASNVVVIANKIDSSKKYYLADAFAEFGFGLPLASSAEHGIGEAEIRELIAEKTADFRKKSEEQEKEEERSPIKLALIGRPNVGKSSIANALFGERRVIVSDIPGTTRESVRVKLPNDSIAALRHAFELFDTAGLHPQNRISTPLDYFSSLRTRESILDCHVVFLVIDALGGITKLDKKIADNIIAAGKGVIVVVNKWDIAQKSHADGLLENFETVGDFRESFAGSVREELRAFPGVDVVFIAAKTGYGTKRLLPLAEKLYGRMNAKIGTGELNRVLQSAMEKHPPSTASGRSFKVYYAVQTGNMPFVFKFFCNRIALLIENYKKYLLNVLRSNFDLAGCAINLEFSEKDRRFSADKK
jgi:GTP-binding protein